MLSVSVFQSWGADPVANMDQILAERGKPVQIRFHRLLSNDYDPDETEIFFDYS